MKRESSNRIRYVMEEWMPPALRDSAAFRWLMERYWGSHIRDLAAFRRRAPFLTDAEYKDLYVNHPRIHHGTDNSRACVERIVRDVTGASVCDVGCGTGYLLQRIGAAKPGLDRVGVDLVAPSPAPADGHFLVSLVERLPFADAAFDTVVCTHVLEHILDYRRALAELRRVARRRLILVVPQEREGRFTFNPHFNFFAYRETFLRAIQPVPESHDCTVIGRDIYYREDLSRDSASL